MPEKERKERRITEIHQFIGEEIVCKYYNALKVFPDGELDGAEAVDIICELVNYFMDEESKGFPELPQG